jgi:hypothetical protein
MQSINMFSTYGKLQLIFFTIPTSKNTESVRSLFGTCWEPVGNRLAGSFSILTGLVSNKSNLNWLFGHLTFFGHCVSALARWPLAKSKYLISLSILGFFLLFAHQNCCNYGVYSKTAIKPTIRGSGQNLWEMYFCTYFVCIVWLHWFLMTSVLVMRTPSYLGI